MQWILGLILGIFFAGVASACTQIENVYPVNTKGEMLTSAPLDQDFYCAVQIKGSPSRTVACGFLIDGADYDWCPSDKNFSWIGNVGKFNCHISKQNYAAATKNKEGPKVQIRAHDFSDGCNSEKTKIINIDSSEDKKKDSEKSESERTIEDALDSLFGFGLNTTPNTAPKKSKTQPKSKSPSSTQRNSTPIDYHINGKKTSPKITGGKSISQCEQIPKPPKGSQFELHAYNVCRGILSSCGNPVNVSNYQCLNSAAGLSAGAKSIMMTNTTYATCLQCMGYAQGCYAQRNNTKENPLLAGGDGYPYNLLGRSNTGLQEISFQEFMKLKPGTLAVLIWVSSPHIALATTTGRSDIFSICEWNYDWHGSGRCRTASTRGPLPEKFLIQVRKVS